MYHSEDSYFERLLVPDSYNGYLTSHFKQVQQLIIVRGL